MHHETPASSAVRGTLDRVLASETFARSERARKLLTYLVEQEQAGNGDRLKGFAIAVDVFGKAAEFDPSTDAVVRVQAGRLRDLLAQYFATEGAHDPVRITVPRGCYVPSYAVIEPAASSDMPPPPVDAAEAASSPASEAIPAEPVAVIADVRMAGRPPPISRPGLLWATMGVAVALLSLLFFRVGEPSGQATAQSSIPGVTSFATSAIPPAAALEILPLIHISTDSEDAASQRVAAVLRRALSGFDTVDFIARDHDSSSHSAPIDAIRFVFSVMPGPQPGSVAIELQNTATGKVLLSRILKAAETLPTALDESIAVITSATLPASGAIYAFVEQNGPQSVLISCLLLNDAYYFEQNARNLETAYRCFEKLVAVDTKSPIVYSEMAALHLEAVTDGYRFPPGATEEKALELAHRAVQMGATSAYAHRAYGRLASRTGSTQESVRWMRKAYELNPYDLSMAAAYGYTQIFAGNYSLGTPILARAVDLSSAHPSWWDYGLFLGSFMLDDMQRATSASDSLATAKRSHYLGARVIAARASGKPELAAQILKELAREFPRFTANPAAAFARGHYPADLAARLTAALRSAGMGGAS